MKIITKCDVVLSNNLGITAFSCFNVIFLLSSLIVRNFKFIDSCCLICWEHSKINIWNWNILSTLRIRHRIVWKVSYYCKAINNRGDKHSILLKPSQMYLDFVKKEKAASNLFVLNIFGATEMMDSIGHIGDSWCLFILWFFNALIINFYMA